MAKPRQLKRQRAGNIGKPTGLRIGDRFRGDHEQVQRMLGHGEPRSSFDITGPDEEREVWPDARPEAWKNCRRIRWNALRLSPSQERRRWPSIVRRNRRVTVRQTPGRRITLWSSRHFKPGAELLFVLPATPQGVELGFGQRFAIDQPFLKKHHQPPVIRIR